MPFDIDRLEKYDLFKFIFNPRDDNDPMRNDLSNGRLNEVTVRGAQMIAGHAKMHNINGHKSPEGRRNITVDEKAIIKAILKHDEWGSYFEQDGKLEVAKLFGIDMGEVPVTAGRAPVDAGRVELPNRVTEVPDHRLLRTKQKDLPSLFAKEYNQRRAYFEDTHATEDEKGKRVLGLLRDYAEATWGHGQQAYTREVGKQLLDLYFQCRFAKVCGAKDYNGFGVGAAQSVVLGLRINKLKKSFQDAFPSRDTTHLAMDGRMAEAMKYMDMWRKASGKEAKAEAVERTPYLDYMRGRESGHTKHGSLKEETPFSTSGVNFGTLLFPRDNQIDEIASKPGFEFPIDCLDAFKHPVTCNPLHGESLKVFTKDGKPLTVEKLLYDKDENLIDGRGKPAYWAAKFVDAGGNEVDASDVIGSFVTRNGKKKGDGKADSSFNMWWFGYCDRNTAQRLYKAKYKIPQIDRESVKVKGKDGKIITVPKKEAQEMIDLDISSIVTANKGIGFRFNDEPQHIVLKGGKQVRGKIHEKVLEYKPGVYWGPEDMLIVYNDADRPLLGTIQIELADGTKKRLDTGKLATITKKDGEATVNISMKDGLPEAYDGCKLVTRVDWDLAKPVGEGRVLDQADKFPVRGEIKVKMPTGKDEFFRVDEVEFVAGEKKSEMRPSQYAAWISEQMDGLFANDASQGPVVSNGVRWVNRFELVEQKAGDEAPQWVHRGDDLMGREGKLERQDGDKLVWIRGMYAYRKGETPNNTQFAGWYQVDNATGRILNEGFTKGEPDFAWGANGPLNWKAPSSFNHNIDPEMRLAVFVNGVSDQSKLQAMADVGNLPGSWRTFLVPQDDPRPADDA